MLVGLKGLYLFDLVVIVIVKLLFGMKVVFLVVMVKDRLFVLKVILVVL